SGLRFRIRRRDLGTLRAGGLRTCNEAQEHKPKHHRDCRHNGNDSTAHASLQFSKLSTQLKTIRRRPFSVNCTYVICERPPRSIENSLPPRVLYVEHEVATIRGTMRIQLRVNGRT